MQFRIWRSMFLTVYDISKNSIQKDVFGSTALKWKNGNSPHALIEWSPLYQEVRVQFHSRELHKFVFDTLMHDRKLSFAWVIKLMIIGDYKRSPDTTQSNVIFFPVAWLIYMNQHHCKKKKKLNVYFPFYCLWDLAVYTSAAVVNTITILLS